MSEIKERGVVSFPKCGRTWIRLFLEYYRRFAGLKYAGTKVTFRHDDRYEYRRRVLLVRHPCDVMVSYYLHKTARRKTRASIGQFIRSERNGVPAFNRCYAAWSERETGQIVVRYEDMFGAEAWREMLEFFGIPCHGRAFDEAREATRFDTIRANLGEIATFPNAWRYLAAEHGRYGVVEPSDPEAHKFRRGVIGGYVDYLDDGDVSYILDNFTLGERLGSYRRRYLEESERYHA